MASVEGESTLILENNIKTQPKENPTNMKGHQLVHFRRLEIDHQWSGESRTTYGKEAREPGWWSPLNPSRAELGKKAFLNFFVENIKFDQYPSSIKELQSDTMKM